MSVVAAFDVDGTLTTRDCVVPFLELLAGRTRMTMGMLRQPRAVLAAAARRDRDRFKAVAVRAAFRGRRADDVEALGVEFARKIHASWLRADTPGRLAWHQSQGHLVVLVSASLGPYLRPLGQMLGVDGVLCTEASVDAQGRYSGELNGDNCRGPEKIRLLREWLNQRNLDNAQLWAYGDSNGDRELLSAAHHHFYVKGQTVPAEPHEPQQDAQQGKDT
jgi:phosphatidylglycerophosphatase C